MCCSCTRQPPNVVQFSSRWYLRARESPYALHPVSVSLSLRSVPSVAFETVSNVCLIDVGPASLDLSRKVV